MPLGDSKVRKWRANVRQMVPKGSQKIAKGNQKEATWSQKTANGIQKGVKREPDGGQNATQSRCSEKVMRKCSQTDAKKRSKINGKSMIFQSLQFLAFCEVYNVQIVSLHDQGF